MKEFNLEEAKYNDFKGTLILWRFGRCVIIQIFNELLKTNTKPIKRRWEIAKN